MKFVGDSELLGKAAGFAARHTAGTAPTMPALSGLRLHVGTDSVRLTGYDYEASSAVTVPVTVDEPGEALLPGRVFAEILKALPPGEVGISAIDSEVAVAASTIDFQLPTMSLLDYPELPSMPVPSGTVDAAALTAVAAGLAKVAIREDVVPILSGAFIELGSTSITAMASDRYRVAIMELPWQPSRPAEFAEPIAAVVSARMFAETTKALDPTTPISIGLGGGGDSLLCLSDGTRSTSMRLLDGRYPALRTKVPTEFIGSVTFPADRLAAALRRVGIVADRYAAVALTIGADEIEVGASGEVDTRGRERIPSTLAGEHGTIAFNAGYLLDGLGMLGSRDARLSFAEGMRPALLTGAEGHDGHGGDGTSGYRYVVMPRRSP